MWMMRQLYENRHSFDHLCLLICLVLGKLCLLACQSMPVFIVYTYGACCCGHLPQNVLTYGCVLALWVMQRHTITDTFEAGDNFGPHPKNDITSSMTSSVACRRLVSL